MTQFSYKARTLDGKVKTGTVETTGKEELIRQLREEDLFCFEVKSRGKSSRQEFNALRLKPLAVFCRQLATMLRAGVTMARALDTIYQSTSNKSMKAAVLQLYEGVQKGQALSATMGQMGKAFPELLTYMVETGETSGTLDRIMEKMADQFNNEVQIRSKVQTAMIYPAILVVVSLASVIFMLTSVLPKFLTMYEGVELPAATRALLAISNFIRADWGFLLFGLLAVVVLWTFFMTRREFRVSVKRLALRLPVVGKLMRTVLTSRFASTFSVLYGSGVGILKSIDIIGRVLNNDYVEQQLILASEGLRRGELLSQCLQEIGVFDQMFLSMVLVGEESGSLDEILLKTGDYFEKEANTALAKMVALLEPAMIVILGVVIGFIVIAIILPIFNMYNMIL